MEYSYKILVVDDEKLLRMNLRALLEDHGHKVCEADNGLTGLAVFDQEQPDLVLSDLRMPEMDGLALIAELRQRSPETPVVVISGTGTIKDAIEAVRLGASDYITKPICDQDELEIVINRTMDNVRLKKENRHFQEHLQELVKERTEELRASESRYKRLLESITNYVYTVTFENGRPAGTLHRLGCESLSGFTPDDYAREPDLWYRMVHEDDRETVLRMAEQILTETKPVALEHRIRHKDGSIRWIHNTLVPQVNSDKEIVSYDGIVADITDRKRAEEELSALNTDLEQRVIKRTEELEQSNKQLEAFAFSVSHDLRAPLRHIDGFSKALMEEYHASLDDMGKTYLERVRAACTKMNALIDDLLSFSRFSRQSLNRTTIDMGKLVEEVLGELDSEQQSRNISFSISTLPNCQADPQLLHQVIFNLLSNALKYTKKRESATVEIGSFAQGEHTIYFIRDNGAGFDMQYADKLFGVFQRMHRSDEFEGTGVGLAIVQNIIQRHGGRIWAEAEVDKGATFYFTLGQTAL
jgi:PAS domain S-box-containing protein